MMLLTNWQMVEIYETEIETGRQKERQAKKDKGKDALKKKKKV